MHPISTTNWELQTSTSTKSNATESMVPLTVNTTKSPNNKYKNGVNMSGFACVTSGTDDATPKSSGNELIIEIFEELQEIYELLDDQFRAITYKRSCVILSKLPPIRSIEDLSPQNYNSNNNNYNKKGIYGIGKSLKSKIIEIITTGTLQKLEYFKKDVKTQSLLTLTKIWGVGSKTAHELYNQGYKSIEQIRLNGKHLLTTQQLIGLKHYEDFQIKIPRDEVEEIGRIVTIAAHSIIPNLQIQICGSYRRGKKSSGDVDFLLAPPEGYNHINNVIPRLLDILHQQGFLTDDLTLPQNKYYPEEIYDSNSNSNNNQNNSANASYEENETKGDISTAVTSYMGVCKIFQNNSKYRRIDIKYYPKELYSAAILYFTGSDHFNRSMRLYASKLGYSLNDKGLVRCIRDSKRKKIATGERIVCYSEQDIFKILGLPFKEPHERNCLDNNNLMIQQNNNENENEMNENDSDLDDL